jgi:hypothetical protein
VELSNGRPFGPVVLLDRLRLRSAALRYARHGWAVTPGACLDGARFACGLPGCPIKGCHPEIESWEDHASTDAHRVQTWWRHRPHAVLLATGRRFDAIEVPAALRHRLDVVRHGRGSWIPAAPSRMPDGPVRWAVPPDRAQWALPASGPVQAMLIDVLGSLNHHPIVAVPRQMSTARRAA